MRLLSGLIRASVWAGQGIRDPVSVVWRACRRWLATQGSYARDVEPSDRGWLVQQGVLHSSRSPGNACLSGLSSGRMGTRQHPANPQSKGCGAVMRSAPFGWLPWEDERIWELAPLEAALPGLVTGPGGGPGHGLRG